MRIFSSAATDWDDFDGEEPPARIPFLSPPNLSSVDLVGRFSEFAKFVYDRLNVLGTVDDQLLRGIYTYFIDPLLQHSSGQPIVSGNSLLLNSWIVDTESFYEFLGDIYYPSLTTEKAKYDFQFYLQLGLYHFVVWYLCEKTGSPKKGVLYEVPSVPFDPNQPNKADYYNALFDYSIDLSVTPTNNPPETVTIITAQNAAPVKYSYNSVSKKIIGPSDSFSVIFSIHAFTDGFRKAVTDKVKWKLKCGGIEFSESFYSCIYYQRCFTPEMHINDLLSEKCLGVILQQNRWRGLFDISKYAGKGRTKKMPDPISSTEAVRIFHKLVEAFHDAMIEIVDEELAWLVKGLDATLRDSYKSIRHYGVGDGTPTKALFALPSYGLCFVRYVFDFSKDTPTIALVIPDIEILRAPADTANTNVSILYYGLDTTLTDPLMPSIVLKGESSAGAPSPVTRHCIAPNKCYLVQLPGSSFTYDDKLISLQSMGGSQTSRVTATLSSSTFGLHNEEELVYIIFKNKIPRPSTPSAGMLLAQKSFDSNGYQVSSTDSDQFFTGSDAQTLKNMLLALQGGNNFDFDVESDLIGCGLGRFTGNTDLWEMELPAENQLDGSAANDPQLRRAVGRVSLYYGSANAKMRIVFDVAGYVAPPACSWRTWTDWTPAQKSLADLHIGAHLRHAGNDPIYNPALSAMRAFGIFEGMVRRIIAFAQTMKTAGDINAADLATITSKLTDHLQLVAGAQFSQPGVVNDTQRGPTVVREHDDDTFGDGLGGKKGTVLYIDYKLFHKFDH